MIRSGDRVSVHFTTRSLEGSVMETSRNRDPLVFTAGGDEVVRGLSEGVLGMRTGEHRTLSVPPEHGFGNARPDLIQAVSLTRLPPNLQGGDQLTMTLAGGPHDVWIRRVMDAEAQLDANHPLAGETLLLDVEIVSVDRD